MSEPPEKNVLFPPLGYKSANVYCQGYKSNLYSFPQENVRWRRWDGIAEATWWSYQYNWLNFFGSHNAMGMTDNAAVLPGREYTQIENPWLEWIDLVPSAKFFFNSGRTAKDIHSSQGFSICVYSLPGTTAALCVMPVALWLLKKV